MVISHRAKNPPNLGVMQQPITSRPDSGPESYLDEEHDEKRVPLSERAWQNQRGIMIAVALTLAAVGVLVSYKG